MPVQELPDEFLRPIGSPSNSSLSSTSSDVILINAHYVRNSRSASVSSGTTTTHDDDSFEGNVNVHENNSRNRNRNQNGAEEEEATYQPIKLPTEPTLEELLVRNLLQTMLEIQLNIFIILATSNWRWWHQIHSANKTANNLIRHQSPSTSIFHAALASSESRRQHVVLPARSRMRFEFTRLLEHQSMWFEISRWNKWTVESHRACCRLQLDRRCWAMLKLAANKEDQLNKVWSLALDL